MCVECVWRVYAVCEGMRCVWGGMRVCDDMCGVA